MASNMQNTVEQNAGASPSTPLLDIRGLTVEFPGRRGNLVAARDVSLALAKGEILGVVGESGAGKSTIANAVIGLLDPPGRMASGEVYLAGRRIDALRLPAMRAIRGRRIGMIFQDPLTSLDPLQTIEAQLLETITAHLGMSESAARRRAIELLDAVGIPEPGARIKQYPHQFSGGMRQRAVIALSLCAQPEVLLADEPTTALDVSIQSQILDLMRDAWMLKLTGSVNAAVLMATVTVTVTMATALIQPTHQTPRWLSWKTCACASPPCRRCSSRGDGIWMRSTMSRSASAAAKCSAWSANPAPANPPSGV